MEATVGLDVEVDRRNEVRSRCSRYRNYSWRTLNLVLRRCRYHLNHRCHMFVRIELEPRERAKPEAEARREGREAASLESGLEAGSTERVTDSVVETTEAATGMVMLEGEGSTETGTDSAEAMTEVHSEAVALDLETETEVESETQTVEGWMAMGTDSAEATTEVHLGEWQEADSVQGKETEVELATETGEEVVPDLEMEKDLVEATTEVYSDAAD